MELLKIIPISLISLVIALAFYFSNLLILLLVIPLAYAELELIKTPKIQNQKTLRQYMKKTYSSICDRIIFDYNADVYAFFPSKLQDKYAVVNQDYCVIKSESGVEVYDIHEGIDIAMEEICKKIGIYENKKYN